jgi:type I restriction enzyme S subunit
MGGGNLPLIRFKGYSGKWIKVKLSKYASRITRKNINMETTLPLTISAAEGLIEQTAFFNNVVASSDVSGYYLIKKVSLHTTRVLLLVSPLGQLRN